MFDTIFISLAIQVTKQDSVARNDPILAHAVCRDVESDLARDMACCISQSLIVF